MNQRDGFIDPHGGFRNLKSYQTNFLLDQQLRQFEKQFLEQGGFTEKLYRAPQSSKRRYR